MFPYHPDGNTVYTNRSRTAHEHFPNADGEFGRRQRKATYDLSDHFDNVCTKRLPRIGPGERTQKFVARHKPMMVHTVTMTGSPQSDQRQQAIHSDLMLDQGQVESGAEPAIIGRHAEHMVGLARSNRLQQCAKLGAQCGCKAIGPSMAGGPFGVALRKEALYDRRAAAKETGANGFG